MGFYDEYPESRAGRPHPEAGASPNKWQTNAPGHLMGLGTDGAEVGTQVMPYYFEDFRSAFSEHFGEVFDFIPDPRDSQTQTRQR